ncbi:transglutaminase-like cysteine peptidase [Rhodoblastus acidophilus]|uniref:Transglutaminase-like cysteine peptidase n=1 Tax=Candidatus Rhodoblastus alkanivorans TaxID=2954117 RepID=A0ABS9Z623_9HYPH|nr:transglutaminase-like cysteine peptidase [Candidatus Rhodoblastus alkanivorans]MCI4678657.1 transglutaminase-like cysteine peptidase [Candidatus Rhodoblastus alkanivorans]MCI4683066.1 transglutaminase-like cysteine peptidase [Candidatus Rhodoblastus alkanivorans]MDI4640377.1 transglutaminase-like cysteine peptidase [Rhodoblastus acidophilus]
MSRIAAFFLSAALVFAGGAAEASGGLPTSSFAVVGGETSIPYGWIDFCQRQPQECSQPVLPSRDVKLDAATWRALNHINAQVNAAIEPVSNYDHWGTMLDHWDYPTDGKGDCKIYALYKRKLLIDRGFPRQALLMTIVRDHEGEGHAILTVKTDHGDFILDNLTNKIRPWTATGYRFLKRQSQEDPNVWVSFAGAAPVVSRAGVARINYR